MRWGEVRGRERGEDARGVEGVEGVGDEGRGKRRRGEEEMRKVKGCEVR
jgi:hypothetical protein